MAVILLPLYALGAWVFTRRVLVPNVLKPFEDAAPMTDVTRNALAFVMAATWPVAWVVWRTLQRSIQ